MGYHLRPLGYEPVKIETPEGKATYVAAQRAFAARAPVLRRRLLEACDALPARGPGTGHGLPDDGRGPGRRRVDARAADRVGRTRERALTGGLGG